MNEENFKKGIKELKDIRMTNTEKTHMIKAIFSVPIKSPYVTYMSRIPTFALGGSLILLILLTGTVYASGASLPGDVLYPIKTKVVESVLNVVNSTPEKKIVWEGEKVTRRLKEAKKLAEKNELNDEHAEKLEREIEKGSIAFIKAVNAEASSSMTSTSSALEKAKDLKKEFRRKINESEEDGGDDKEQSEKIEKIKTSVIKILDDENKSRDEKERGKGRRDDKDDGDENKDSDKSGKGSD
ncbi:MAG: DUF5667 domain-containing protein [bacterium]|nr:DUF5667 domain-containing protein [bacterium]